MLYNNKKVNIIFKTNKNPQIKIQILLEKTNIIHMGSQPFLQRWFLDNVLCFYAVVTWRGVVKCPGGLMEYPLNPPAVEAKTVRL